MSDNNELLRDDIGHSGIWNSKYIKVILYIKVNIYIKLLISIYNLLGYEMFRNGDHGRLINGIINYEEKSDTPMKIRGERVGPTEISQVLNGLEQV